jgi:excisionase family DNA binding protein
MAKPPDRAANVIPLTEPLAVRIPEACRLTGIGRSKLYELIADGTIEVAKVGSMTLIPFECLRRFIDDARKE